MTETVDAILESPGYKSAVAVLDREHDRIVEDIIRLTEIASPPFGEDVRGDAYLAMLREHGLEVNVEATRHDIDGLVEAIIADHEARSAAA